MARRNSKLGGLMLGIYLILTGLIPLVNLHFSGLSVIMALLAIVTGVLFLMDR